MTPMAWLFWVAAALVFYAYMGYPLLLRLLAPGGSATPPRDDDDAALPTVTMLVPAHNEMANIGAKLTNTKALDYPAGKLEVIFISDGSTDGTTEAVRAVLDDRTRVLEITTRGGKAGALNAGLAEARHDIVVFTDASILLEPGALRAIVRPFADPQVGCVSGEDRIAGSGGEALYGRYELFIRRQEARLHSIVGASGSFYAQRRTICEPFIPNVAPDFWSVLKTVEKGYRALAEPEASGHMAAVERAAEEFERKVRTLLRGMTTLGRDLHLLNPFRYGAFAWCLFSHKVVRWLVPVFLLICLVSSAVLALHSRVYAVLFALQAVFYLLALAGLGGVPVLASSLPAKVAVYFTTTNAAALVAWVKYFSGVRQEIWAPSRRA
jgi:cellulose synthase/poly-beta-1,6-N-acetylglucosamine synthase-like glycosyltransferase